MTITKGEIADLLKEKLEAHIGRTDGTGYTQTELATYAEISQSHLSRILSGQTKGLGDIPAYKQKRLLERMRFSPSEIRRIAREYDYMDALKERLEAEDSALRSPTRSHVAEGPTVKLLGSVSAGTVTGSMAEDLGTVYVPDWIEERYGLEHIFALDVAGDSMTCEEAHKSIPEGSRAYFHSELRPEGGDIIVCRLRDPEISVLKKYRPDEDYVVLESYNQRHKPIVLTGDQECQVEGVYLTHIPRTPRLR